MRRPVIAVSLLLGLLRPAAAFVYFEHAWFSDRGCRVAQHAVAEALTDDGRRARYLALALVCPERTPTRYCADGRKFAQSQLNRLDGTLTDHAVTFGDFSGLADHVSRFGPVRGLARLGDDGLIGEVWRWFAEDPGDPGGVVGDIAEEGCEHEVAVPWAQAHRDVARMLTVVEAEQRLPSLSVDWLAGRRRTRPRLGPDDPDALYSFDNPHFLDLQLSNHTHFGLKAYQSWLGLHGAAVDVGQATCAEVVGLDADALADLDDADTVDWDALAPNARRAAGCRLLRGLVRARLLRWAKRADPALVAPVAARLQALAAPAGDDALLDQVVAALHGALIEGVALHYLEDGFAGGHARTDRSAQGLAASRYTHDLDGDDGLAVVVQTRAGAASLVAYGDRRMFGPELAEDARCDSLDGADRATVTTCLLRHQRGLVTTVVAASVADWVAGGRFYGAPADDPRATPGCAQPDALDRFICRGLPIAPPAVLPAEDHPTATWLAPGDLPVPPAPFDYEALLGTTSIDLSGGSPQAGARLVLLTELGSSGHWMRSHDVGLNATLGDGADDRMVVEYAHRFHWRWAARFLVDAGPYVFIGASHLATDAALTTGVGPTAGLTFLPEGWTKIPLQLSFDYRAPLRLLTGAGYAPRVMGHFLEIGLGFAFM